VFAAFRVRSPLARVARV